MKKLLIAFILSACLAMAGAVITETASLRNFLYGTEPNTQYDNWVSHLAEGIASANYNLYAPYDRQTNGFGDFNIPSVSETQYWNNMLDLFLAADYDGAQAVLDNGGAPYQIVQFNDTDTGRIYYMIRELPDMGYYDDNGTPDPYDDEIGAFDYGWGLFIYNPQGTRPIIVTVPHPCDDFPTPAIGLLAFQTWNAKFLLINGAGREVKWSNIPPYTNAKSISDPTRYAGHPFHLAYLKFADQVRAEFGWREFSAQIHTCDWNRYPNDSSCQISAGYNKNCPNLPIRDLSVLKHDLINRGRHVMLPANTVGMHDTVYLNDYYGVSYSVHEFIFTDGEHTYPVNNNITLPAYSQNNQMLHTLSGWNDYDSYEPFFHIEMDELPNLYLETQNTYHWFYGWNEGLQKWDLDNLFTHFLSYYSLWVYDLETLLDEMFAMNDGQAPTTPTDLTVLNQSLNSVTLGWNRSSDYDFDTYEVLFATEPIGFDNFAIFNRSNSSLLASQASEAVTVTGLNNANHYYFRLRAKDKNGNYSEMSNQVDTILAPANITTFTAHGMDSSVRLYWQVGGQTNNQGFSVYRKQGTSLYQMLDSWETNPELTNPTASTFVWWDYNVDNDEDYTYMISSTNQNDQEFFYNYPKGASPRQIKYITISNLSATLVDSIAFGINPYATDGNDNYFDQTKGNPSSTYVWNAFWQPYWGNNGTQLSREIKGFYDLDSQMKTWTMRTRSDQINETISISASGDFGRAEKLWLLDSGNGTYHDLLTGPYQYTNGNSNIRTMTLYWGNMQPRVYVSSQPNRVVQGGSTINFSWSYQFPFLIEHVELSIINDTDSLLVSALLSNANTSFSYQVPQTAEMQNCRLAIDVVAVDGIRTRFWSDYRFALVPLMVMAYNEPGWKTRSNPWTTAGMTLEQVFGPGSTGYVAGFGGPWVPATDFEFGTAYWVHNPEVNFFTSTDPIQSGELSFPLLPGWNFIPNPHLCSYELSNIRFEIMGNLFRFSELLSQQLVSSAVYVLRDNAYLPVDRIEPFEALLIKYYGSADLNPMITFVPFYESPSFAPPPDIWNLSLRAEQAGEVAGLKLGAHLLATDNYDFRLDLPAPPAPPYERLDLWFPVADDDTTALETRLISDLRTDFTAPEQEKFYNFKLLVYATDPVEFSFDQTDIPDGWQILMMLNETPHYVGSLPSFTWTPSETGTYDGYIRVSNYQVGNSDLVQGPFTGLVAYPNPFNPEVNIAFNLFQSEKVSVDIYNLRGQKVKTLVNNNLSGGSHILRWDGRDHNGRGVASGVYFARVQTNRKTQIIRMMLMK